jgi:hypothetical protein
MKAIYHSDTVADENAYKPTWEEKVRLTITILEKETAEGVEDWTPTIVRLKEVLAEAEATV